MPCVPTPVHNWFKLNESYDDPTKELKKNRISAFSPAPFESRFTQYAPAVLPTSHVKIRSVRSFCPPQGHVEGNLGLCFFIQPDTVEQVLVYRGSYLLMISLLGVCSSDSSISVLIPHMIVFHSNTHPSILCKLLRYPP